MSCDDFFRKDRPDKTLQITPSRLVAGDGPEAWGLLKPGIRPVCPQVSGWPALYLQSTLLSCAAAICHLPSRFNQVSVQTWHCFASGCVLSLPMACSLP